MKKNYYILLAFILFSINSCFVKEPEPRENTEIKTTKNITVVNTDLPFTYPTCSFSNNSIRSVYSNFNIYFNPSRTSVIKTSNSFIINAEDNNSNKIKIVLKESKTKSVNFNVTNSIDVLYNDAYIEISADASNNTTKFELSSMKSGKVHLYYDAITEISLITFCDINFDVVGTSQKVVISGKIEF